jgi:molybdopterin molybdotransferase
VRLARDEEGSLTASPFSKQDSSMISILSQADGLLIRPPHAPAIKAGARATVIPLGRR